MSPKRSCASAPDGTSWRVGRRWVTQSVPRAPWRGWRPWRRRKDGGNDADWFEALPFADADGILIGIVFAIAAAAVMALLVFLLLPLIGIAFELALLFALFGSGLFGRVFLRRPWIVEAVSGDDPAVAHRFAVKGWRRSRRAIAELKAAIPTTGVPAQLTEAERLPVARDELSPVG